MGKATTVSPFAPKALPDVPLIAGVRFATAEAGIRYKGRTDLLLAVLDPGTTAAGVLTQLQDPLGARRVVRHGALRRGMARALVVNSGNANAFTGKKGPRGGRDHGRCRRQGRGVRRRRGLHRLDRRDRRADGGGRSSPTCWTSSRARPCPTPGTRPRARS